MLALKASGSRDTSRAMENRPTPVYLDYNATAPLRPSAKAAIADNLERFGNPSSVHRFGRDARALVEDTREALAAAVGALPANVIFTSDATEANGLALRGFGRTVLAAAAEHPSVLAHVAPENVIPVDGNGIIDLKALDDKLRAVPNAVVALMAANNETGVIQPVAEAAETVHRHGAFLHCDAVQALGKMPINLKALSADSLSFSAHKLGGAKGIGALVLRPALEVAAQSVGGGQERRRRAGTENTLGIASFGAVVREQAAIIADFARCQDLRTHLELGLRARAPDIRIFGADAARVSNTTCYALAGMKSEAQIMALDLVQIAVSAGSACSSGKVTPSHVLLAMGADPVLAACAIRVSLGWDTTLESIDRFLAAFETLVQKRAA
jgi:cysteine desulfurase